MKLLLAALLAAGAICIPAGAFAGYDPDPACTSSTVGSEVPSGTWTDANGRKWAGFSANGSPPDSLTKDSTKVTCTEEDGPPPPP